MKIKMTNDSSPLISIIVPVYNVEPYVSKCLESILRQTYQNIEIIIIDDGSTDGGSDICDAYAHKDKRIKVIHQSNEGLSGARNVGLRIAKGEFIGFVDSDDWIEADMYEYLLQNIQQQDADIAICGKWLEWPKHGQVISVDSMVRMDRLNALSELIQDKVVQNYAWDKRYRASLFQGVTYPKGKAYEDIAVAYQVFLKSDLIIYLPLPKYHYLQRKGSIVWDASLKKSFDFVEARYNRYLKLGHEIPQLVPQLQGDCVQSFVTVWSEVWPNRKNLTLMEKQKIMAMAAFAREHFSKVLAYKNISRLALFRLYFVKYPTTWSYGISRFLCRLSILKHWRSF